MLNGCRIRGVVTTRETSRVDRNWCAVGSRVQLEVTETCRVSWREDGTANVGEVSGILLLEQRRYSQYSDVLGGVVLKEAFVVCEKECFPSPDGATDAAPKLVLL